MGWTRPDPNIPNDQISETRSQFMRQRLEAAESELTRLRETNEELMVKLATARLLAKDYAERYEKLQWEVASRSDSVREASRRTLWSRCVAGPFCATTYGLLCDEVTCPWPVDPLDLPWHAEPFLP